MNKNWFYLIYINNNNQNLPISSNIFQYLPKSSMNYLLTISSNRLYCSMKNVKLALILLGFMLVSGCVNMSPNARNNWRAIAGALNSSAASSYNTFQHNAIRAGR